MEHLLYLIRGIKNESYPSFQSRILKIAESLKQDSTRVLKVSLTVEKPPILSPIPFKKKLVALITTESEKNLSNSLSSVPGFCGEFRCDTAIPVGYRIDWPCGYRTPGAGLLTLLQRKRNLDDDTFFKRWFDGHTPMSLEIHPMDNYVRNRITERTAGTEKVWDGIVEEHLLDENLIRKASSFFGYRSPTLMTMLSVWKDIKGFLDVAGIESYFVREYVFKWPYEEVCTGYRAYKRKSAESTSLPPEV